MLTGAAVLPTFAVRNVSGEYEVHVEVPIKVRNDGDRENATEEVAAEFVARLEPYVLNYPDQWSGWFRQAYPTDRGDDRTIRSPPGADFED